MKPILTSGGDVYFNEMCYPVLNDYLKNENPSKIIILVDTNTEKYCLENLKEKLDGEIPVEIISVEAGEEYKTLETCKDIWEELTTLGADRNSLIINLGGGVVTDMGGFVACTFRRGIKYINIPTTLLSMVDAAIGGKTGVDLGNLKNQIGVIQSGDLVLIDTDFLKTLPTAQLNSGFSEMLKHGLIYDRAYWDSLSKLNDIGTVDLSQEIYRSVLIKNEIVEQDPFEKNIRKSLNFGHTLGHAVESFFLDLGENKMLLHGEAIAAGMILESYISKVLLNLPERDLNEITSVFNKLFKLPSISSQEQEQIMDLLKFDKKNSHGNINFVLLKEIGKPEIDCLVKNEIILEAFQYYNQAL